MTADAGPAPVTASVLFLRLRPDGDEDAQAGRRDRLVAALQHALAGWDAARRVVLDAPEGFAVVGEVAPAVALASARLAVQLAGDPALGAGLHHGPVRALRDTGGTRIVGDGLDTAAALAGFVARQPIVASQAFRDALAGSARIQAEALRPAGEMVDERLRPHALFVFDPQAARRRAWRRNFVAAAGLLTVLGAGWAGRVTRLRSEAAARRPATIHLDIRPSGNVVIDGIPHGVSPPMVEVLVAPGPHRIEVRSGRSQPLRVDVYLEPGEEMQVSHVFPSPAPARRAAPPPKPKPEPGPFERFKFW